MAKTFRDLAAFKRGVDLVLDVYEVTSSFPKEERYGLVSQMRRSSVGVVSQIAEGQGRLSFGEWRQFLSQARGSLFEVEAQTFIASRLGFMDDEASQRIAKGISRTGNALIGLIGWVRKKERAKKAKALRNRITPPEPGRNPAVTPP
jgi:four helix bundle protein